MACEEANVTNASPESVTFIVAEVPKARQLLSKPFRDVVRDQIIAYNNGCGVAAPNKVRRHHKDGTYVLADEDAAWKPTRDTFLCKAASGNEFIGAVIYAYCYHCPLALKPSLFWMLIMQAISRHVDANHKELRERFVHHKEEEEVLSINWPTSTPGKPTDWGTEVTSKFFEQLRTKLNPDVYDSLEAAFTTTTEAESVCGVATIIKPMDNYFASMPLANICGFPGITLEGTLDDWVQLRERAEATVRKMCTKAMADRWLAAMLPALDKIVDSYKP